MKCPNCGYAPPRGRPKKLDDKKVKALHAKGLSLRQIAAKLRVTHGAVRASLLR
jgi:DNA-binding NarL/FixJ family response regulator